MKNICKFLELDHTLQNLECELDVYKYNSIGDYLKISGGVNYF